LNWDCVLKMKGLPEVMVDVGRRFNVVQKPASGTCAIGGPVIEHVAGGHWNSLLMCRGIRHSEIDYTRQPISADELFAAGSTLTAQRRLESLNSPSRRLTLRWDYLMFARDPAGPRPGAILRVG
jgi:hypothetical protein